MDFIVKNKNSFICIRGFSSVSISQFIRMVNEIKGINIKPIKISNEILRAKYKRHILTKEDRIKKLHNALENINGIETSEDYIKISNRVFGERRANSCQKIKELKKL